MKNYWTQLNNTYDKIDSPVDDIINCICIDAWKTEDDNEDGKIITKVIKTKSGDVEVVYIDNIARKDKMAQYFITKAKESLQKK